MQVRDIMTTEVFTLRSDHFLDLAEDMMNWQRIRHLPVIDDSNHLMGLVTHRDLLKISLSSLSQVSSKQQREIFKKIPIGEIMNKKVLTVTPTTDLRNAAAIMIDEKVGCLPVVENKKLVGIITEADFLTLAWEAMGKSDPKEFTSIRKYKHPGRVSV